ncbi:putative oligopeptidase A [Rosa chinensis]|uniref:Putative oligopeptidase A n=1 Tax=Rosa chinensis TaxID=74649 RepID=A0A2P6PG60_ROSCH|nr:putative oligopeptidase A [Rosa chinensis]
MADTSPPDPKKQVIKDLEEQFEDPIPLKKLKVGQIDNESIENNPLLEDFQFPRFDAITADHIRDGITILLQKLEEDFTKLENMIELEAEPTWSTVVLPFKKIVERMTKPCEIVGLLKNLKDSEELRDALKKVLVSCFSIFLLYLLHPLPSFFFFLLNFYFPQNRLGRMRAEEFVVESSF